MSSSTERRYGRAFPRFDVSLFGSLISSRHSVTVRIANLSLGGALVYLPIPAHSGFSREVKALTIDDYGSYPCRVVLTADRRFHIAFSSPAAPSSRLGLFLAGLDAKTASDDGEI